MKVLANGAFIVIGTSAVTQLFHSLHCHMFAFRGAWVFLSPNYSTGKMRGNVTSLFETVEDRSPYEGLSQRLEIH
jgi:hypothetical protein